jgi:hypothetical protein
MKPQKTIKLAIATPAMIRNQQNQTQIAVEKGEAASIISGRIVEIQMHA